MFLKTWVFWGEEVPVSHTGWALTSVLFPGLGRSWVVEGTWG